MDPRRVPPLPDSCPWSGWSLPDIKHCEANLCAWITTPANAWSNLAYIGVGAWIMARAPRHGALSAWGLGPVSIAVGLTSFAFHASYTFAGQALDYGGMFLLTGWAIARAALRAELVSERAAGRLWAALVAGSMLALFAFRDAGWGVQTIMLIQAAAVAGLEIRLMTTRRDAAAYGFFWLMLFLVAAAYACWHLDHLDSLCRPDDHWLQLHALWHLLTAGSLYAAWRFHGGIDSLRRARMNP